MTQTAGAQQSPVINHIAYYTVNLKKSTHFYQHIVGLDTIPEPFHDGKHTWFNIGSGAHLHLIEGARSVEAHNKNSHLCFSTPSVDAFVTRLKKEGVPFEDWPGNKSQITTRVDGVKQIYFQDPDGHWIEVNDDWKK